MSRRHPLVAALLGFLVPGLGQVYAGRPGKGALYLATIFPTFLLGWWLTGFSVVDPEHYPLDMIAQVFLGLPIYGALEVAKDHVLQDLPRWLDVGRLYVQVAGLLNLVAVADAVGLAIRRDRQALAWRQELAKREVDRAAAEAAAAAAAEAEAASAAASVESTENAPSLAPPFAPLDPSPPEGDPA